MKGEYIVGIDHIITLISTVVATYAAVCYFKDIKKNGNKKQRFIENAKKNNFVTTGTSVNVTKLYGDSESSDYNKRHDRVNVKYEYYVNGTRYFKYMWFLGGGGRTVDYPSSVNVYYDPKKPEKGVCAEEARLVHQMESGCLGATVIWLTINIVLINFFTRFIGWLTQ